MSKPSNKLLWQTELTRRKFLKGAGLTVASLGFGSVLQACAPAATPTPVVPTPTPPPSIGGTLQFLGWEGYDLPEAMEEWREANGVVVEATYIGSNEDVPAKLAVATPGLYDLVTTNHGYRQLYTELGILTALEVETMPNYEDLYEFFRGEWWIQEGQVWAVPFTWGSLGCNYNADEISPPASWRDLLDPSMKDRFAVGDDMNAVIPVGARILGWGDECPNLTLDQLTQVMDLLLEFKRNARAFASSYGDLTDMLVSGEIVATLPGWAAVNVWAQEGGVNVQHTMPSEGGVSFVDAYSIPPDCDNRETALAWINESITAEAQAIQARNLVAGVVNPEALPLTEASVVDLYPYDKLDELFENAPLYELAPSESEEYATLDDWVNAWEGFKAG